MKKFILGAIAATAVMAGASAASAATNFTNINLIAGSSIFGATTTDLGAFNHTFNFSTSTAGDASSSIITVLLGGSGDRDIDFSSIDLDGHAFVQQSTDADGAESWVLAGLNLGSGNHSINVHGTVLGGDTPSASYSGTLNVAVPEPGTWALMITGFGAAGAMIRRKRALALA